MNSFMITGDGRIVFTHGGNSHTVDKSHVNYHKILTAIKGRKFKVADELANNMGVRRSIQKLSNKITINGDQVLFDGQPVGGLVVERILKFIREGLPYKPLIKFLENIQLNPSSRAVNELYTFLEHRGLPLTESGHFIAYKGIRDDWMDIYSGKFDNHIGKKPEMKRNEVDDDCNNTCSKGLHVGTHEYASEYARGSGGRVVLVEVNPADAVSVPLDHNAQKLRVWTYKVVAEAPALPIKEEVYGAVTPEDDDWQDCDETECSGCGEGPDWCICDDNDDETP